MSPQKIVLRYSANISNQPIIYSLIKTYDLEVNIVKANVNPQKEGLLVLEINGDGEHYDQGIAYLKKLGVIIQPMESEVVQNKEKCIMCGACTGICPTKALYLERPSMEVRFDPEKCIVCKLCVRICPMKAMELGV